MFYVSGIEGTQRIYSPSEVTRLSVVGGVTPVEPASAIKALALAPTIVAQGISDAAVVEEGIYDTSEQSMLAIPAGTVKPDVPLTGVTVSLAAAGHIQQPTASAEQRSSAAPLAPLPLVGPIVSAERVMPIGYEDEGVPKQFLPPSTNPYTQADDSTPVRKRALVASQIMTAPVFTVSAESTVEATWKVFHERHFRHVPVVSAQGKLIGIVSDRDFSALGLDHVGRELTRAQQLGSPTRDIMTTNVLTARPGAEIRSIARVMFTENISAMPIVNDAEEMVGIITTKDVLRTLVNEEPLELWT